QGICGMELVEVSPPYDTSDITALLGTRVIVDVLGAMVSAGTLGKHKPLIDKPVSLPAGEYDGGRRWSTPAKGGA
ncbi:MAG: arginase family protein, partial [Pseudomonadota bacterium]